MPATAPAPPFNGLLMVIALQGKNMQGKKDKTRMELLFLPSIFLPAGHVAGRPDSGCRLIAIVAAAGNRLRAKRRPTLRGPTSGSSTHVDDCMPFFRRNPSWSSRCYTLGC